MIEDKKKKKKPMEKQTKKRVRLHVDGTHEEIAQKKDAKGLAELLKLLREKRDANPEDSQAKVVLHKQSRKFMSSHFSLNGFGDQFVQSFIDVFEQVVNLQKGGQTLDAIMDKASQCPCGKHMAQRAIAAFKKSGWIGEA